MEEKTKATKGLTRWVGGGRATRAEVYGLYIAGLLLTGGAGVGIAYAAGTWDNTTDAVVETVAESKICITDRDQPGSAAPADCTCVIEGMQAYFPDPESDEYPQHLSPGRLVKDDRTDACHAAHAATEQQNLPVLEAELEAWNEARVKIERQREEESNKAASAPNEGITPPHQEAPPRADNPVPTPPPATEPSDPNLRPACVFEKQLYDYHEPPADCWCVVYRVKHDGAILWEYSHAGPDGSGAECHRQFWAIRNSQTG